MTCDTTIHIIDDDQEMLESLSVLLTVEGYSVRTYKSAGAFLDAIKHHACGCVVTDMNMPGMSGTRFVDRDERTKYHNTDHRYHGGL